MAQRRGVADSGWQGDATSSSDAPSFAQEPIFQAMNVDDTEAQRGTDMPGPGRDPSNSSIGSGGGRQARETPGRKALSYSIRHHAAILQHKSAGGQNLEIHDPTDSYSFRPTNMSNIPAQTRPANTFSPPPVSALGDSFYVKPVRVGFCVNKRCALAFAAVSLVAVVSIGFVFGVANLDFAEDIAKNVNRLNAIAPLGETSTLLVSGIIPLPDEIESNLRDVAFHTIPGLGRATPFYFMTPLSGGQTMQRVTESCLDLVEASELGREFENENELEVKKKDGGGRFLNVDATTPKGLERARDLGIIDFEPLDVVYSPELAFTAKTIFTPERQGSVFLLVRDPVERIISIWDHSQEKIMGMTLEEYIKFHKVEKNSLTRAILQKHGNELHREDKYRAMEIMRRKILVGLSSRLKESLERFRRFHGWQEWGSCVDKVIALDGELKNSVEVQYNGPAWKVIAQENDMDMELYEYAISLFEEQATLVEEEAN